jgi:hypothetical protein
MPKKIVWTDQAKANLRAIDQPLPSVSYILWPGCWATGEGDVNRLQDIDPPEFRLRVGNYRVRFHDSGDAIEILSVKHRREAYR